MRPPPSAISAAASRSVVIADAGSQSADSQRRTRFSISGCTAASNPSQSTTIEVGSRCVTSILPSRSPISSWRPSRPVSASQHHGAR